jgi:type II secretion system protein G
MFIIQFCKRKEDIMKNKGFTLIELLIVVAIIAILAAIAVPNFLEAQVRAKCARVKNDLRQVDVGLQAYRIDNSKYPYPRAGIGVQKSQLQFLTELTTPVSFLTSVAFPDPFQPKNWGKYVWVEMKLEYLSYQYSCYEGFWRDVTFPLKDPHSAYCLSSNGPDRMPQFLEWAPNQAGGPGITPFEFGPFNMKDFSVSIYDPTNGTMSKGDIGRYSGVENAPTW